LFRAHKQDIPTGRMNELVIDFADPGSISAEFLAKVPGPELSLGHAKMVFSYQDSFATAHALEGYERLILLAMIGDQSLFTSSGGIERLWEISEPLLQNPPPAEPYANPDRGAGRRPAADRAVPLAPAGTLGPARQAPPARPLPHPRPPAGPSWAPGGTRQTDAARSREPKAPATACPGSRGCPKPGGTPMALTDPWSGQDDDTGYDYYDTPSGNIWRPGAGPGQPPATNPGGWVAALLFPSRIIRTRHHRPSADPHQ
jgi:hypothetical protein